MNKTTALVGLVSGLAGAGGAYAVLSRDTSLREGALTTTGFEPSSNVLNPTVKISASEGKKYENAIKRSRELAKIFKDEIGIPGVVVGVSVDGNIIWEEGLGYANLETRTPCNANTAMRIASISKPITMALLAKLRDNNKIDFDKSIHDYVPYFPRKRVDGEEIDITIRQLASHTAGVRHYKKKGEKKEKDNRDSGKEFYYKERVDSVEKSVEMFKDDELLFKPGTSFEYTTHGYTLLSAAAEKAGGQSFPELIENLFKDLNLQNTYLDRIQILIQGRASYYDKNKRGRLVNAELADLSYKWAGGGIVSTVGDLLKFANAMLYSYQQSVQDKPGYLKKETVQEMWTSVDKTTMKWGRNSGYGLGWTVVPEITEIGGVVDGQKFHVGHSGGAVGTSSVLVIMPRDARGTNNIDENVNAIPMKPPLGVAVAVLVNLENVGCKNLAKNIADEFIKVSSSPNAPMNR